MPFSLDRRYYSFMPSLHSILCIFLAIFILSAFTFAQSTHTTSKTVSVTKSAHSSAAASGKSTTASKSSPPRKKSSKSKISSKSSRKNARKPRGQKEIESSRVIEIQTALAGAGVFRGEPTGFWDLATSEAMKTFQQSNGFKITGKPDALSLKKLGL
jgi:hypothetical protein